METKTDTTDWSKKLPSQILFEAANVLEEGDRWFQGSFFGSLISKPMCFCAHGAIQYCGREPKIRKMIENGKANGALAAEQALSIAVEDSAFSSYQQLYQTWPVFKPYYHLFLAHAFAWTVGCTFNFNDIQAQSKEEVVAKLREAAAYALEHQHKYLSPPTQP